MNQFCLNCKDAFTSPMMEERGEGLGRNMLYTFLVFTALCAASYLFF